MAVEYRIISIGALAQNLIWKENRPLRATHATCTLLSDNDRLILVDPSLPADVLAVRFFERTGKTLDAVTDVFCTTLRPDSRRALPTGLPNATYWAHGVELEWYGQHLEQLSETVARLENTESDNVEQEIELIRQFRPAPEKFSEQISLYPLPGPTPGCCGLLLTPATNTILITGPAAPTREHLERGMIWEECTDKEPAMESLGDVLEIADVIIPGYDNVVFSPGRWM